VEVRPIDGDEGFYTTAARLVWEGKTPYQDFFFQQAPFLPYIYSWIWAIHPCSLLAMRFFSAACGGIAVFLWGVSLVSAKRLPIKAALATFVVILLNPYWVSWNVVVKTFAVANLLMSIATICLYAALHSDRVRWYFLGGLALGACASVRSLYGPLIPCVSVWLFLTDRQTSKPPFSKTLTLLTGAACGLLPMIFSFSGDPHAFIFNNVQYHGLQAGYRWVGGKALVGYPGVGQTLQIYFRFLVDKLLVLRPYFTAEVLLSLVGGLSLLRLRRKQEGLYTGRDYLYFKVALLMLAVYTVTALIPFPPYEQYFTSPLIPFLVPFMTEGLRVALMSWRRGVGLLVLTVPVFFSGEIRRETLTNSYPPWCQLSSYGKVVEAIKANSRPGDVVLSFWPGYVFESGRRYFPGLTDHFVYRITSRIGSESRSRYHVVSKDQVTNAVSTAAVNMLIIGAWMGDYYENLSPSEIQKFHAAVNANYSLVSKIDDVAVYRRGECCKNQETTPAPAAHF
jgi:dolichyl-phosphate-mannose-protein mannosyltransferase